MYLHFSLFQFLLKGHNLWSFRRSWWRKGVKRRASTLNRWRVSIFKIKFTEFVQLVRFQRNAGKWQKVVPISIPKCRLKAGLQAHSVPGAALSSHNGPYPKLLQLLGFPPAASHSYTQPCCFSLVLSFALSLCLPLLVLLYYSPPSQPRSTTTMARPNV